VSYVTYTTNALVCGSFEQGPADKSFLLFTREAGMLYGTAKSVREERSKQRTALQDFSRIRVSLIKGKSGWRVGSVEVEQNDFSSAQNREIRGSVATVYRLLRRFIRGEEASPQLYDFVTEALDVLLLPSQNRKTLELFVQLRILAMLGYVDEEKIPQSLFTSPLKDIIGVTDEKLIKVMEILIEKASDSSHL
jgi:recombinational DNA repair protein (RecF pathway)